MEEHISTAFKSTLGQLLASLDAILPIDLSRKLCIALETRNFLAHHFWFDRIRLMATSDGVVVLLNDLDRATELFQQLDHEVEEITLPLVGRIGLTPDAWFQIAQNPSMIEDDEPLLTRRRPKKEELIVAAYNVPTETGTFVLTFQTEDGELWELCDAGLGWSAYSTVEPTWTPHEKLSKILPAKVNPRPRIAGPWTYEIVLRPNHRLVVSRGMQPGQILYKLCAAL